MFVAFGAFFGIGVPHAQPGDFGDAPLWMGGVFFASITLLGFFYGFLRWKIRRSGTKPELHSIEPPAKAKPCGYCGRENDLEAENCRECGSPFPNSEHDQIGCKDGIAVKV